MTQLLVIEDESTLRLSLRIFFESNDYEVLTAETGGGGIEAAKRHLPDIVLLDLRLPDAYGLDVLKAIKSAFPDAIVYIMTAFGDIGEAIEAIRSGAENYFQKPIDLEELGAIMEKSAEVVKLRRELAFCKKSPYPLIGRSRAVQGLTHLIKLLADNNSTTVLITGETGTGKELVARNIHALGATSRGAFVDVNCASIPDRLLESELFGYEPGAFTDATSAKKGLMEIADKGTLFLDEIAEMSPTTQAKLLRVLETRTFHRLGGTKDIRVNVRFMAATNKDLETAVKKGSFREDLYYRLNVMPVEVPPLRERPEDIELLAGFFLGGISSSTGKKLRGFDKEALRMLRDYRWPGNIRELRNIIERAAILATGQIITSEVIALRQSVKAGGEVSSQDRTLDSAVRSHILEVLKSVSGNKTKAAKILGISRSTLMEKLKQYMTE